MNSKWLVMTAVTAVATASCAAPGQTVPALGQNRVSPQVLLDSSPLARNVERPEVSPADIIELNPEMLAFLDDNVDRSKSDYTRLRQLLYALMGGDRFQLIYDDRTRTAEETFRDRRGNCLSFTNLFVAMARNLGLDASYQEVEIPPDWSLAGQSFVLSKHVNVYLRLSHDLTRIVDFNTYDFNTTYEHHVISDERARAHYYNNIGAELMLNGETPGAFANLRASIGEDPNFSPAWINLGTLYRREAYRAYAEAAFQQALKVEPHSLVAMSNLANLYEEAGLIGLAADYQERVETHRMRNPYYRYFLANEAFTNGDYAAAIEHLKYAIREREEDPRFYSLISLSYLMSGDRAEAGRWMRRAEEVAVKEQDREKYSHKLQWLMHQSVQQ